MIGSRLTAVPPADDWSDLDAAAAEYAQRAALADDRGRDRLRENLIRLCLPFAGRIAARYRNRGEPLDDIEQVARVGLVKAVDRYDPLKGSFTAYAVLTATGEIKKHFRDRTWAVHVPRSMHDLALEVRSAEARLSEAKGTMPTPAELADHLRIPVEQVRGALVSIAGHTSMSLNAPAAGETHAERGDFLGDEDPGLLRVDDRLPLAELLPRLPARERWILAMRFHGNRTQGEIAAEVGVSQMHVSRIISRTLVWLREAMLTDSVPRWDGTGTEPPALTLTRRHDGAGLTVRVEGEADRDTAGQLARGLRQAVHDAAGQALVIDLTRMPFLGAAGVEVFADAARAAGLARTPLRVRGACPLVTHVLRASGLGALLRD
jgi:RNA polymerase sigma-B factor